MEKRGKRRQLGQNYRFYVFQGNLKKRGGDKVKKGERLLSLLYMKVPKILKNLNIKDFEIENVKKISISKIESVQIQKSHNFSLQDWKGIQTEKLRR